LAATLVNTGTALCTSSSLQQIGAVIESAFPSLGISRLAIALYEDGQLGDAMVRVLLLHGGRVELEPVRLQARELPDGAFPGPTRATLIVSALHSKADVFGIVCMDLAAPTGLVHEAVRESLSARPCTQSEAAAGCRASPRERGSEPSGGWKRAHRIGSVAPVIGDLERTFSALHESGSDCAKTERRPSA
jgi:hypothetical protein